jgi:predicted transcriptional regulator
VRANTNRGNQGNTSERENTLTARVRRFFVDNQDEELTTADLMSKFDITRQQVNDVRKELVKQGVIETVTVTRALASLTRRRQ